MNEPRTPPFPDSLTSEPDARELRSVWAVLGDLEGSSVSSADTDSAWESVRDRLGRDSVLSIGAPRPGEAASDGSTSGVLAGLLRAAVVAGLLLGGTWIWHQVPVVHSVGAGELVSVMLPDGSEVTLNAGSSLWHRRGFRPFPGMAADQREVRLQGEAFFDVIPSDRPFQVEAAGARVTVLGTRFNVRARAEGDTEVRVSVEEGRVRVVAARAAEAEGLELGGGESGWLADAASQPRRDEIPIQRIGAWRGGGLVAVDEALGTILEELALRYDVPVRVAPSADASGRLNVYYRELDSLESVLSDLAIQQGLSYRRTSDGWEVF